MLSGSENVALIALCGLIVLICAAGIIKGFKTGNPPGQKGLKGTRFEYSKRLMVVQVCMLFILMTAAIGAMIFFLFMFPQ